MNLFTCGCLKRVYTESMHKSVVFRYCEKHSPEVAIDRDPFDITKHEFSDLIANPIAKQNLESAITLDVFGKWLMLDKHDAIAIAKALGVTAEDLK